MLAVLLDVGGDECRDLLLDVVDGLNKLSGRWVELGNRAKRSRGVDVFGRSALGCSVRFGGGLAAGVGIDGVLLRALECHGDDDERGTWK